MAAKDPLAMMLEEKRRLGMDQAAGEALSPESRSEARNQIFNPAPITFGEKVSTAVTAGTQQVASDISSFKSIFQTISGDTKGAEASMNWSEVLDQSYSAMVEPMGSFEEFLDQPTWSKFMDQVIKGVGMTAPQAIFSVASGGTGAIAGFAGKAAITHTGKAYTRRKLVEIQKKKLRKEALTPAETNMLEMAFQGIRSAKYSKGGQEAAAAAYRRSIAEGLNLPTMGFWAGSFAQGEVVGASQSFKEFKDAGYELTQDEAWAALALGVPQAALDVLGEKVFYDVLLKNAAGDLVKAPAARAILNKARKRGASSLTKAEQKVLARAAQQQPAGQFILDLAKAGATGFAVSGVSEGITETLQEEILIQQRKAIDPEFTNREANLRRAESAFVGFFAGAARGAPGGVITEAYKLLETGNQQAQDVRDQIKEFQAPGYSGDVVGSPVKESPKDIKAQVQDMFNSIRARKVVLVTEKDTVKTLEMLQGIPEEQLASIKARETNGGVILINTADPESVAEGNRLLKLDLADGQVLADALGFTEVQKPEHERAVVVRDEEGNLLFRHTIGNSQNSEDAALANAQRRYPDLTPVIQNKKEATQESLAKVIEEQSDDSTEESTQEQFDRARDEQANQPDVTPDGEPIPDSQESLNAAIIREKARKNVGKRIMPQNLQPLDTDPIIRNFGVEGLRTYIQETFKVAQENVKNSDKTPEQKANFKKALEDQLKTVLEDAVIFRSEEPKAKARPKASKLRAEQPKPAKKKAKKADPKKPELKGFKDVLPKTQEQSQEESSQELFERLRNESANQPNVTPDEETIVNDNVDVFKENIASMDQADFESLIQNMNIDFNTKDMSEITGPDDPRTRKKPLAEEFVPDVPQLIGPVPMASSGKQVRLVLPLNKLKPTPKQPREVVYDRLTYFMKQVLDRARINKGGVAIYTPYEERNADIKEAQANLLKRDRGVRHEAIQTKLKGITPDLYAKYNLITENLHKDNPFLPATFDELLESVFGTSYIEAIDFDTFEAVQESLQQEALIVDAADYGTDSDIKISEPIQGELILDGDGQPILIYKLPHYAPGKSTETNTPSPEIIKKAAEILYPLLTTKEAIAAVLTFEPSVGTLKRVIAFNRTDPLGGIEIVDKNAYGQPLVSLRKLRKEQDESDADYKERTEGKGVPANAIRVIRTAKGNELAAQIVIHSKGKTLDPKANKDRQRLPRFNTNKLNADGTLGDLYANGLNITGLLNYIITTEGIPLTLEKSLRYTQALTMLVADMQNMTPPRSLTYGYKGNEIDIIAYIQQTKLGLPNPFKKLTKEQSDELSMPITLRQYETKDQGNTYQVVKRTVRGISVEQKIIINPKTVAAAARQGAFAGKNNNDINILIKKAWSLEDTTKDFTIGLDDSTKVNNLLIRGLKNAKDLVVFKTLFDQQLSANTNLKEEFQKEPGDIALEVIDQLVNDRTIEKINFNSSNFLKLNRASEESIRDPFTALQETFFELNAMNGIDHSFDYRAKDVTEKYTIAQKRALFKVLVNTELDAQLAQNKNELENNKKTYTLTTKSKLTGNKEQKTYRREKTAIETFNEKYDLTGEDAVIEEFGASSIAKAQRDMLDILNRDTYESIDTDQERLESAIAENAAKDGSGYDSLPLSRLNVEVQDTLNSPFIASLQGDKRPGREKRTRAKVTISKNINEAFTGPERSNFFLNPKNKKGQNIVRGLQNFKLPNIIGGIQNVLSKLGYQRNLRIFTPAELKAFITSPDNPLFISRGGTLEQSQRKGIENKFLQILEEMQTNKEFAKYIGLNDTDIIVLDPDLAKSLYGIVSYPALVYALGHEMGHAFFKDQLAKLLNNPALRNSMYSDFEKAKTELQAKGSKKYDGKEGFEEWFADQTATWFTKLVQNQRASNASESFFKRTAENIKLVFDFVSNTFFKGRFTESTAPSFEAFYTKVLQIVNRVDETSSTLPNLTWTEELIVRNLTDEIVKEHGGPLGQKQATQLKNTILRLLKSTMPGLSKDKSFWSADYMFRTADGYLRSLGKEAKEIAKLFYSRSSSQDSPGYMNLRTRAVNKKLNSLYDTQDATGKYVFRDAKEELDIELIQAAALLAETSKPTASLPVAAKAMREFLKDFHKTYIMSHTKTIQFLTDFFPRRWLKAELASNPNKQQELASLLRKYNPTTKMNFGFASWEEFVAEWATKDEDSDSNGLETSEAGSLSGLSLGMAQNRQAFFNKIPTEAARRGLDENGQINPEGADVGLLAPADYALKGYIEDMVKKLEYEAIFTLVATAEDRTNLSALYPEAEVNKILGVGPQNPRQPILKGWQAMEVMLARIPNDSDRRGARKAVEAQLGKVGQNMSPFARKVNSALLFGNMVTLLTFAAVASLPDVAGPILRSRDMNNKISVIVEELRHTIKNKAQAEQFARDLGVVTHDSIETMYINAAELGFMTDTTKRWARTFFQITLLEQFTKFTRVFAAGMGEQYLVRTAEQAKAGDETAIRHLKELNKNLTPQEVLTWASNNKEGRKNFSTEAGKKVNEAIGRFVEESIVRPNAAERPVWASNPYFALVWQLKSFFYAFGKNIVGGAIREGRNKYKADGQLTSRILPLLIMAGFLFPLTAIGLELREFIKYLGRSAIGDQEGAAAAFRSDEMPWGEWFLELFDRSGILGPFGLVFPMVQASKFGDPFILPYLGPTAERGYTAFVEGNINSKDYIPFAGPII
jgi:hypothetical protein